MNWIRIAVGMKNDASISRIADACKVRVAEAVGCVVNVLAELPAHARDGNLANTPDRLIEQWAVWEGKRGVFAPAFREHLTDENGVVRAWEKHNGAAIREADTKREEAKKWREKKAAEKAKERESVGPTGTPTEAPTEAPPNAPRRSVDGTGRDGTVLLNSTELQASLLPEDSLGTARRAAAKTPKGERKYPHFVEPYRSQVFDVWKGKLGKVNEGLLTKAIGPCFRPPDDPAYVDPKWLVMGVVDYCGLVMQGRGSPWVGPDDCAKRLVTLARNCERLDNFDPVARVDANYMAIHGHRMPGAGAA